MKPFNLLISKSEKVSNIFALLTLFSNIILIFMFFWNIVYITGTNANKAFSFIVYFASLSNILIGLPFFFNLRIPSRALYYIYALLVLINLAAYITFIIEAHSVEGKYDTLSVGLKVLGSIGIVCYGFFALILFLNFGSF
jgi:hypothetical protein